MKISNIHIAAFSGSLRQASLNHQLIQTARQHLPDNSSMEILDLTHIPFYNQDLERNGFPEPVQEFRSALYHADAILIATP